MSAQYARETAIDPEASRIPPLIVSMAKTRLELASIDFDRYVRATFFVVVLAASAVGLVMLALGFLGLAVVAAFWEAHRLWAVAGITLTYVVLAAVAGYFAASRWRVRPGAFDATVRELERDHDAVTSLL